MGAYPSTKGPIAVQGCFHGLHVSAQCHRSSDIRDECVVMLSGICKSSHAELCYPCTNIRGREHWHCEVTVDVASPDTDIRHSHCGVDHVLLSRIREVEQSSIRDIKDVWVRKLVDEVHEKGQRLGVLREIDVFIWVRCGIGGRKAFTAVLKVGFVSSDKHPIGRSKYDVYAQGAFLDCHAKECCRANERGGKLRRRAFARTWARWFIHVKGG